jgi:UDPglucose 6-dehydrogenase
MKQKIGFIGQGWIGKNLADHFDERGFVTCRYGVEPEYAMNKDAIGECDIVFIAVPTPSTPEGFDDRILRSVMPLVGMGKTAVIKSTILPGTTDQFAALFPDRFILHSPEFLRETSVRRDIDFPDRNIVGVPSPYISDRQWLARAEGVMAVLPDAPYKTICRAPEAELTKYGGNNFLYTKVVFMNMLYDLATAHGASWDVIAKNLTADPRIGASHMEPVHQYDHMSARVGRGAGGHCFIKDFAAFRQLFERELPHDEEAISLLRAFESKNNKMLRDTGKDLDLLDGVYGKLGSDIVEMEEVVMKEGDDIEAMQKAYDKNDLQTLEAAYLKAGKDLERMERAYIDAGGDIRALSVLRKQ